MVNNNFAIAGIGFYVFGMYLHVYNLGDYKISIIFCLIGAAIIMFEFIMNSPVKDEVE